MSNDGKNVEVKVPTNDDRGVSSSSTNAMASPSGESEIADRTGLAAADVHAIANTFQGNLTSSNGNPEEAIEAAAAQHGVDTATVREIITRAGGLENEIGDIVEHAVKLGDI